MTNTETNKEIMWVYLFYFYFIINSHKFCINPPQYESASESKELERCPNKPLNRICSLVMSTSYEDNLGLFNITFVGQPLYQLLTWQR